MVSSAYMLERDPPAGAVSRAVDQRFVPGLMNAIAPLEQAARVASDAARARPVSALLGAFLLGFAARRVGRRLRSG